VCALAQPGDAVARALTANRPSRSVAFHAGLSGPGAWEELIRDVVAMANSGGGVVVVGLDLRGQPTGWDAADVLGSGRADLIDDVAAHVGDRVEAIDVVGTTKADVKVAAVVVGPRPRSPLVFERAGTYLDGDGQEQLVFPRGAVYVRHGGKSDAASTRDLARLADAELRRLRRDLVRNLRKVSIAPTGSEVIVVPPDASASATLERFQIVDDPSLPAVARTDFDVTHPYRQKELLVAVNDRAGRHVAGAYEIQCVRRVFDVDSRPDFIHKPKFGSPQYSEAYVIWLTEQLAEDPAFYERAKARDRPPRAPDA
jgi:hypothetical protein